MAERSQHSNILLAFISLTAVIVIVSLIGFFTLGKGPEIIQGQAEADEIPCIQQSAGTHSGISCKGRRQSKSR